MGSVDTVNHLIFLFVLLFFVSKKIKIIVTNDSHQTLPEILIAEKIKPIEMY